MSGPLHRVLDQCNVLITQAYRKFINFDVIVLNLASVLFSEDVKVIKFIGNLTLNQTSLETNCLWRHITNKLTN